MEAARTMQASASSSAMIVEEECGRKLEKVADLERELQKRLLHAGKERLRLNDELRKAAERRISIHLAQDMPALKLSILTGERRAFMKERVEATGRLNGISASVTGFTRQALEWHRSLETALDNFSLPKYMSRRWENILRSAETASALRKQLRSSPVDLLDREKAPELPQPSH
jgi:hypothetical protein